MTMDAQITNQQILDNMSKRIAQDAQTIAYMGATIEVLQAHIERLENPEFDDESEKESEIYKMA